MADSSEPGAPPAEPAAPEAPAPKTLDAEAVSAAISGFLACHVLTLRFLVQEGVLDKDRLVAFLDGAAGAMRPGLADPRSLFALTQVIEALRQPEGGPPLQ